MLKKMKNLYKTLKENVFLKYPVTICNIWIASLLTAVVVDFPFEQVYYDKFMKITIFFWIFAAGNLLVEELFDKYKKLVRLIGFILSAAISGFFIIMSSIEQEYIFGIKNDTVMTFIAKLLLCYLTWIAMFCIFKMYQKSEVSFEKYCLSVFGSTMRTTIVYGIFALGLAIIILIFNVLIFDTDDFILRIETLLACGLYIPGMILAFSKMQDEIGKFLRVVVKYVLLILEMTAFLIIYIYIAKLVISWDLPSNEVFPILSWLFVCGLPIWTVAMYFKEDKLGKVASILPYVFIPFIILQMICIGLRIQEYGLTQERYVCCYLIVAEIIYLILFSIKKRKYLPTIFLVAAILVSMFCLAPIINCDTMVYLSQKSRFETLMEKAESGNELTDQEIRKVLGAYREIKYLEKGDAYVKQLPSSYHEMIDEFEASCTDLSYDYHDYSYVNCGWDTEEFGLDVSNYKTIYVVTLHENDYGEESVNLSDIVFEVHGEEKLIDLSDFSEKARQYDEEGHDGKEFQEWLYQNGKIQMEDGSMIVIYQMNVNFRDDTCIYYNFNAFYLE